MSNHLRILLAFIFLLVPIAKSFGQATPPTDTIVFVNGDKLVGHFVSATGSAVKFKSDVLGDLSIDWSKVKELRTNAKVAVIRKGVTLSKHSDPAAVPQGTFSMEDQKLQLASAPPQTIPVAEANTIIDQPAFEKAVNHKPGFFSDWGGTVTLGASLVSATQDSKSFNGAIALIRAEPTEGWLTPRNRTIFDFSAAYGELSQPNTPTVKSSIFHGDAERDEYLGHRVFAFGQAAFDHNFSQGLDIQQTYGGGIGWTAIQRPNVTLDLKAAVTYIQQQFQGGSSENLIGSIFAEHYRRGFKRGLVLDQVISYTPAWNEPSDYSALGSVLLTLPVFKRLGASAGVIDNFLNDPPPGFKKNSLQFSLGFTYTLR